MGKKINEQDLKDRKFMLQLRSSVIIKQEGKTNFHWQEVREKNPLK